MSYKMHILVCGGTGCRASASHQIITRLEECLKEKNLEDEVQVIATGCFGFCEKGPIVKVMPDNTFYVQVKPDDAEEIVNEHVIKGRKVERLLYKDPEKKEAVSDSKHMGFYKKQLRIALRNCGFIDPENIEEYIAREGYSALAKCITEMKPEEVINEIKLSGLRGRGGGGFPTGLKWEFASKYQADQKYVVCNADEGDPGAFMDRSIMEGDPHSVIEAMAICGYSIGTTKGLVYIRAEYPLAIQRLKTAIHQAEEFGLLGENIFGTDFSFNIELRYGAGAFVCGEETALIHSMEGHRGEPTMKPPFPAESGYLNRPTNVNNVETLANIPAIIMKGANWFNKIGTERSKGTKVFALAGKIKKGGLAEVPMGLPVRDVIFGIGGGIKNDKEFKAVQMGGPSGGCIPASLIDTPVTYEDIVKTGAIVGSGGMIVMDEDTCMVDMARYFLDFTRKESCGKCNYCRIGTKRMLEILERITRGEGRDGDIELLEELAGKIKDGSLCGLGQTAPNPVLTTLKYFRNEYEDHIYNHKCTAGSCKALIHYEITDKCIGCTACSKKCPVGAISGQVKGQHVIDQTKCIKCGKCEETCKFGAIVRK